MQVTRDQTRKKISNSNKRFEALGILMEEQSILKQIVIGAAIGLVLFLVQLAVAPTPDPEPLLGARGLGRIVGSSFAGIILYMLYYRLRQRTK